MVRWLRRLTIEQWQRIDQDYRREPFDSRALIVLLTVALALVLPHYFGGQRHFEAWGDARELLAGVPYRKLHPHLYWALFKTINYLLLPALVIKLVYKERLLDYGFRGRTTVRLWLLYGAMLLAVLAIAYVASGWESFMAKYPKYARAGKSWTELLLWEAAYGYQFVLLEFFFRGFFLYTLARYCGHVAVFIMVIPYCMIHFYKPLPETLGSIVTGIVLGTLALRTRSIMGGIVLHCSIAWSMDLFVLWRKGAIQHLLD